MRHQAVSASGKLAALACEKRGHGTTPLRGNIYVSLSSQLALQKRLDTIANNIANMNTPGFRAEGVTFNTILSKQGDKSTAFVSTGASYITRAHGAAQRTDNPLDVTVQGDAWLAVKTPAGQTVYTRDGRMQMTPAGGLETMNGYKVLDAGQTAMLLDPNGGRPIISQDGMITQDGRQMGAIGLFTIPDDAKLTRFDNSGVIPDKPATPVLDFSQGGLVQGYVESSNVNPVLEMTKLIEVQRNFDSLMNASQQSETNLQDAIKTLGSSS